MGGLQYTQTNSALLLPFWPVENIKLNKNIQTVVKLEGDHKVCKIFQLSCLKSHFHILVVF